MASTHSLPIFQSPLLAVPLEIRLLIYEYCIPRGLVFDGSDEMYYQNRPPRWNRSPRRKASRAVIKGEEEDGVSDGVTAQFDAHCRLYSVARLSALPALLLLCRQINDEAGMMLYGGNTFTFDLSNIDDQRRVETQFGRANWERIRKISLVLRPAAVPATSGLSFALNPNVWDSVLRNLTSLGVSINNPSTPHYGDVPRFTIGEDVLVQFQDSKRASIREWVAAKALSVLEHLVYTIRHGVEIVVDVAWERAGENGPEVLGTVQAMDFFQTGPFRFEQLPAASALNSFHSSDSM